MLGKYDRIDIVDLIYRDRVYPNTYLLTGDDIESRGLEVDLTGDLDFNEMQTSNRKTACRLNDIQDLFDFLDAIDVYYKPYCQIPNTLLVGGEKDCLIQPDLTFDWIGIDACNKVTSSRKFTKYPQGYVKASTDDIKYYEVMFDTVPRNEEDLDGDVVGEYSICIRGRRRPSLKEATEFCKEDMNIMSKSYGDLFVVNVAEIDKEDAYTFFDMDNEDKYPIFE